jgi:hypothetical protein
LALERKKLIVTVLLMKLNLHIGTIIESGQMISGNATGAGLWDGLQINYSSNQIGDVVLILRFKQVAAHHLFGLMRQLRYKC